MKLRYGIVVFALTIIAAAFAPAQTSWIGVTSTAWGTASNWTAGVPTAAVDAIIGNASFTGGNQPTVNVAAACKTLTVGGTVASTLTVSSNLAVSGDISIGSNGTIAHGSPVNLSLTGNWNNSGTYSATNNNSAVIFSGGAQSLTGATTFRILTINASSTLTLLSAIGVLRPLTVNGILDPGTNAVTMSNTFTVGAGATIRVNTALFGGNYSIIPSTMSNTGIVDYASTSVNQTVAGTIVYGTLRISGGMTKSLSVSLPALSSATAASGNILVAGGTLDLINFTANRGVTVAGGSLIVLNGATLRIASTNTLPANYAIHAFGATSTVEYYGGAQSVSAETYGHLTLSNAGNKTAAGAMTLAGNFSLTNATFIGGAFTHTFGGNWTMSSGAFTNTGTTASFTGAVTHTVSSTGAFNNLIMNSSGGSLTAASDLTVNGVLTLTNGNINTGVNKVAIGASGSVSRTSGHIVGNLQKNIPLGNSAPTFEIGDAGNYTPVNLTMSNVTTASSLIGSVTAGDHPNVATSGVNPAKSANRYWSFTNNGVIFDSTRVKVNFVPGDVDPGASTANFIMRKYNGVAWSPVVTGARTATSTEGLNVTAFSQFQVGELNTYTITATAGANGTLTPSGSVVVNHGSDLAFTVAANSGYHIDSVLVDNVNQGPVGSYTFTNVTANHSIRTVYTLDQDTILASAGAGGTISPNGTVPVNIGADQSFTITPNTGYHIDSVLVDGVNQGAVGSYTFFTLSANHTIRAVFAINLFTISASSGANGSISPSGSIIATYGSDHSFTVTANTGYHIDSVVVDGVDQGPVGSYTFVSVTANHTIHAAFAINQYAIIATAGPNGSISPNGSILANYGSDHSFTVTANTGYHIDSVLVDGVDQGAVGSYTFTNVTASHTIHATFAIDQFTIAATAGSNGSISPNGSISANYGSDQSFTVTANAGYHIDSVSVDGADQGPIGSYTFTNVTANHTIHATFAIDQFTIVSTAGPNGSISPNGTIVADFGSNHAFTITPDPGYHVADVHVDSVSVGAVTAYTFVNVTGNQTIHATFAIDTFTIAATAGSNGSISPNGSILATYGSDHSFTITANPGYHIDIVLVDGVDQGPVGSYTFTNVTAGHTIHATFAIDQFTISASAGSNGSISPGGSVVADYGSDHTFTITADLGYHIADVHVDSASVGAVASYTFTNVTANHTIHATFAIDQFTIAATAGANGDISPGGSILTTYGSDHSFTITADLGYHIADVHVDSVSVGAVGSYTFTNVTANHTIHATFAIDQFTIASTAGANGDISPKGSILTTYGSDHSFTITADLGYHIADVHVDSVSVGAVGSYSFTNVTANHTIHATFAIDQFTIAASAGANGSISPNGSILADYGSDHSFTVTANSGYHIDSVLVDGVDQGPVGSYTFTGVTAGHTIHASFAINHFTIAATAGANGSISPGGSVSADSASDHTFTITPDLGYHIADVHVDSVSVGAVASYTFTNVVANHTIHATFAIDQFTIVANAGSNGSISPNGSISADYGSDHTFTITPDLGYAIADVHVDSVSVGAVSSYTFTNVTANHTIHADFALSQFTIAASAGANGLISPNGSISTTYGANQSFTITADLGYYISDVHADSVSVGAVSSYTFTNVTSNHTIHADFARLQYSIVASAGLNGTVTPTGSSIVNYGDSLGYNIAADAGYYISDVHVDSVSVGALSHYTFVNVTANHTISASFLQILNPAPRLFSVSPSNAYRGDTVDVTYHGLHFIDGVTQVPGVTGLTSAGFTILSDTVLVHRIAVDANAAFGAHGLYVLNIAPGGGYSDTVAFTVLNHIPTAALLSTPADGDTMYVENLGSSIDFTWHPSTDLDPADALSYVLHLTGPGVDTTLSTVTDTTANWSMVSLLQVGAAYRWTVNVSDGHAVTASPDTFTFHVNTMLAVKEIGKGLPTQFALHQNFPNPFNPTTNVRFDLPRAADVKIVVYNIIGQSVATLADQASMSAGYHEVTMDAGALPSGIYFYRITATEEGGKTFVNVKKMMLVK